MSALIKATSDRVPAGEAVFFRSFFAMPVIFVWLAWRHELRTGLKAVNPMGHVWRGVVGTMAMGLGFAGLAYLPLPEVTTLGYAAPLLTVIFAAMFLGEEVRAFRISAVALGLVGVLIVLSPRPHGAVGRDGPSRGPSARRSWLAGRSSPGSRRCSSASSSIPRPPRPSSSISR